MERQKVHWGKAIFWGTVTALLYAAMFNYAELIIHMAHTTPDACVIGHGHEAVYLHKVDAAACAAKEGTMVAGTWWHILIPILIAFAISFTHGAFTGLFWELMGLKPAKK